MTNRELTSKYALSNSIFILSATTLLATLTGPNAGYVNSLKNRTTLGVLGLLCLATGACLIPSTAEHWTAPNSAQNTPRDRAAEPHESFSCDDALGLMLKHFLLPLNNAIAIIGARLSLAFIDLIQKFPRLTQANTAALTAISSIITAISFIATCYYLHQLTQERKSMQITNERSAYKSHDDTNPLHTAGDEETGSAELATNEETTRDACSTQAMTRGNSGCFNPPTQTASSDTPVATTHLELGGS
jgi:hypothetical protein